MSFIASLLRNIFRRNRVERELDDELRSYLDLVIDQKIASGMAEPEARHAARLELGGVDRVKESVRDVQTGAMLLQLAQDVRYGIRSLCHSTGFTLVAIGSLAIGIGANAALFSVLDALMLKSLPVKNAEDLRILTWVRTDDAPVKNHSGYNVLDEITGLRVSGSFSYRTYQLLREQGSVFQDVVAYAPNEFTVAAAGTSDYSAGHFVSGNYFNGLGVQPFIGRPIVPEDDLPGNPPVAVITYHFWQKRFGLDPGIIGTNVFVNRMPTTVVGVMPPAFQGLYPGTAIDIFVPITMVAQVGPNWYSLTQPDNWWVQIFGRLRPGVTDAAAASAVRAAVSGAIQEYSGQSYAEIPQVVLAPGSKGVGLLRRHSISSVQILAVAVLLILLITCTNLANLLLARSAKRSHEIAVRMSVGATRSRLVRQLGTESLLLAAMGGLAGLALAKPLSVLLVQWIGGPHILGLDVHINARTLGFTLLVCFIAVLLFGLAPAFRATRVALIPSLKSGRNSSDIAGRLRLSRFLIPAQVALSVLLLVGAGLFIRTLRNLENADLGFRADGILTFQTDPSRNGYEGKQLVALYQQMQEKLAAIPGVESVGSSHHGLIQGVSTNDRVHILGRPETEQPRGSAHVLLCSETFLPTVDIQLVLGRHLTSADDSAAPRVAVVNEAFAKQYLSGENPIGRAFFFGQPRPNPSPIQVVGVVRDARYTGVRTPSPATVYLPYAQSLVDGAPRPMTFAILTAVPPLSISGAVRQAVAEVDPTLPVAEMRTQEEQIRRSLATERMFATSVSAFGLVAAVLTAIGLYGLLAYTVGRRTAEIGIRIALGARRHQVQWLIIRETVGSVVVGLVIGVPAALALTRLAQSSLYEVHPSDPWSLGSALCVMIVVAAISAWLPARRASQVDPMNALRVE